MQVKEGKHTRRDQLLRIQAAVQELWDAEGIFEVEAPLQGGFRGEVWACYCATAPEAGRSFAGGPCPEGKFFGNFPYPYMNGLLHLGHAFSLSKVLYS